jgi:C4-dicarboxylate-specific signal transduction histidine kinase
MPGVRFAGKRQADLFPPEKTQAHMEKIERVFASGEALEEDELERWVEERTAELRQTNERLQAEGEERRRTEQALRESEKWMQMALDVSPFAQRALDA